MPKSTTPKSTSTSPKTDQLIAAMRRVEVAIRGCSRCGKDHDVEFFDLTDREGKWTHWGICPATGQPIMMKQTFDIPE